MNKYFEILIKEYSDAKWGIDLVSETTSDKDFDELMDEDFLLSYLTYYRNPQEYWGFREKTNKSNFRYSIEEDLRSCGCKHVDQIKRKAFAYTNTYDKIIQLINNNDFHTAICELKKIDCDEDLAYEFINKILSRERMRRANIQNKYLLSLIVFALLAILFIYVFYNF